MLNSGTTKLDQILTMRQSSKHGLGYIETTNIVAIIPKTVFVKAGVTSDVAGTFKTVSITVAAKTVNTPSSGKNSTLSLSTGKRRFVPICHFVTGLVTFAQNALNIKILLKWVDLENIIISQKLRL